MKRVAYMGGVIVSVALLSACAKQTPPQPTQTIIPNITINSTSALAIQELDATPCGGRNYQYTQAQPQDVYVIASNRLYQLNDNGTIQQIDSAQFELNNKDYTFEQGRIISDKPAPVSPQHANQAVNTIDTSNLSDEQKKQVSDALNVATQALELASKASQTKQKQSLTQEESYDDQNITTEN